MKEHRLSFYLFIAFLSVAFSFTPVLGQESLKNSPFINQDTIERMSQIQATAKTLVANKAAEKTQGAPASEKPNGYFDMWHPESIVRAADGGPITLLGRSNRMAMDMIQIMESADVFKITFLLAVSLQSGPYSALRPMTNKELHGLDTALSLSIENKPQDISDKDYQGVIDDIHAVLTAGHDAFADVPACSMDFSQALPADQAVQKLTPCLQALSAHYKVALSARAANNSIIIGMGWIPPYGDSSVIWDLNRAINTDRNGKLFGLPVMMVSPR